MKFQQSLKDRIPSSNMKEKDDGKWTLFTHEGGTFILYTLSMLAHQQWLGDEVIWAWVNELIRRNKKTTQARLYKYHIPEKFDQADFQTKMIKLEPEKYDYIFLPVSYKNLHWHILVLTNVRNIWHDDQMTANGLPTLCILDSLGQSDGKELLAFANGIKKSFEVLWIKKTNGIATDFKFNVITPETVTQQNWYDCGVHILQYVYYILKHKMTIGDMKTWKSEYQTQFDENTMIITRSTILSWLIDKFNNRIRDDLMSGKGIILEKFDDKVHKKVEIELVKSPSGVYDISSDVDVEIVPMRPIKKKKTDNPPTDSKPTVSQNKIDPIVKVPSTVQKGYIDENRVIDEIEKGHDVEKVSRNGQLFYIVQNLGDGNCGVYSILGGVKYLCGMVAQGNLGPAEVRLREVAKMNQSELRQAVSIFADGLIDDPSKNINFARFFWDRVEQVHETKDSYISKIKVDSEWLEDQSFYAFALYLQTSIWLWIYTGPYLVKYNVENSILPPIIIYGDGRRHWRIAIPKKYGDISGLVTLPETGGIYKLQV